MAASVVLRSLNRGILTLTRSAPISVKSYLRGEGRPKVDVPPPPRRPLNGYITFTSKIYPQIKQQHPDYTAPEVARTIGAMWKTMPEGEKKSYAPNFKSEMEAYVRTRKAYLNSLSPEQQQAREDTVKRKKARRNRMQKRKIWREFDKPKRPPNGYILFSNQHRANRKGKFETATELFKKIAAEWRMLAEEDKQRYYQTAMDLQETYYKELMAWEDRMIEEGHPELVRGYKKPSQQKQKAAKLSTKTVKTQAEKRRKTVSEE